ncbi:MAG: UDP-N-acetylmuramoyl-L-alanyl-D-glutamate--2,6-diaminopimelate ligase [Candidatus Sungiibacteriota bacterium]|uniref:UDP-N-acetylmuramoyl-L-alanyl-D-glutamate--2, 6-diaminopimelate ligase n=1 Tax=Candidatus Sungiibacteriota bacterium TaxID=2750080 RepID=A0A7T5RJP2_9BACT|nr:MAG: UDP-N-acetylmuramoyl-L-alanyl-D-glutamate--2,6-diaminopimelate ligase [Candidatus Sungbacteria bacterium]
MIDSIAGTVKKIIPRGVFLFLQPLYHFFLAWFAALFYGFPSRNLTVIGVTGTKGKTTVVELVREILKRGGYKVASISSLSFVIGDREEQNFYKMTLPGRFFVQHFLHRARRSGCKYAVLEVTSEGIKQFRHRFIKFDVAILTNVASEHIEAHGSFEKYLRAKLDLFWRLPKEGLAIINQDDPRAARFSAATAAHKMYYGKDAVNSLIVKHSMFDNGVEFEVNGATIRSPLMGEFNFYNILAAAAVGLSQQISLEKIASAFSGVDNISGRMEFIQREPFAVMVDYAHTPDSLRQVYKFLRPKSQRLICVLGAAGGGRDKWKRPEFGKIASEFCDEIILTNEDPYDENPAAIIEDIERGIPTSYKLKAKSFLDRREAIYNALKSAQAGDTVVITGKGAEPWIMGPNNTKIPWDDRRVVREELQKLD